MNEDLEYVNCNLCGRNETNVFLRDNGPFQFVRCLHDGLLYMNPRPPTANVRQFHTQFVRDNNLAYFSDYRRGVLQREAAAVKAVKPRGRLLDVGCATGTFFENFQSPDWRLHGVDTSYLGANLAKAGHGAKVFCGTVREANYPGKFFDVVTVLDTLYYSPDPYSELVELRRILKEDGILVVEIPGYAYSLLRDKGLICWMLDRTWVRGFTHTRHLYYFSPRSLKLLLERAGFLVIKEVPEQASLGRRGLARLLNEVHFTLARALFRASSGRLSIAGKEVYLAAKAGVSQPFARKQIAGFPNSSVGQLRTYKESPR